MAEPMTSILEVQVKCPEVEELVNDALDEFEYKGRTLRQWADTIVNPKTNADRLRSFSDEELADFLCDISGGESCTYCVANDLCHNGHNGMIVWLKKEVNDDLEETERGDAGFGSTGR